MAQYGDRLTCLQSGPDSPVTFLEALVCGDLAVLVQQLCQRALMFAKSLHIPTIPVRMVSHTLFIYKGLLQHDLLQP